MKEGDKGVRDMTTSTLRAALHAKWSTQDGYQGKACGKHGGVVFFVALTETLESGECR